MVQILYILYTFAHLSLLIWGIRLRRSAHKITLFLILLPVIGLIYDNGVVAIGRYVGAGDMLLLLNQGRFWLHALITPVLIAAAAALAGHAGVTWAKQRMSHVFFGILTMSLIIFGLVEFARLEFASAQFGGTLRYVDTAVAGPPIPSIVTIIVVMILGAAVWRTMRWPWLFGGGLVMFVGSAIPPSLVGPVVGSGVEVCCWPPCWLLNGSFSRCCREEIELEYTVALALVDFVPVILSAIGVFFVARMVSRLDRISERAVYLAAFLITVGGLTKAVRKLVIAATGRDLVWLDDLLFVFLGPGFTLLFWSLWSAQRVLTGRSPVQNVWIRPLPLPNIPFPGMQGPTAPARMLLGQEVDNLPQSR